MAAPSFDDIMRGRTPARPTQVTPRPAKVPRFEDIMATVVPPKGVPDSVKAPAVQGVSRGDFGPLGQAAAGYRGYLEPEPDTTDYSFWNVPEQAPSVATQQPQILGEGIGDVVNYASPKDTRVGLSEAFTSNPTKFIPVAGSLIQTGRLLTIRSAAKRLESGDYQDIQVPIGGAGQMSPYVVPEWRTMTAQEQRDRDMKMVMDWENERRDLESRGYSFGGRVGQILGEMPAFMGDLALTSGAFSAGKTLTKEAIEKALSTGARKAAMKAVAGGAAGKVASGLGSVGGTIVGGAVQGTLMPQRTAATYLQKRMPETVRVDEQGNPTFTWSKESPYTSLLKAWGDTVIEAASEQSGGAVEAGLKGMAKIIGKTAIGGKVLPKIYAKYRQLHPDVNWNKFVDMASDKVAFNGILGEVGEEYIGDQMRAVTNVDDFGAGQDAGVLDRMTHAFWQDMTNTPEMLASFAAPAAVRGGMRLMGRSAQETPVVEPGRPADAPYENEQAQPQTMDEFAAKMREQTGVEPLPAMTQEETSKPQQESEPLPASEQQKPDESQGRVPTVEPLKETAGPASDFFEKEERRALQGLGYTIREIMAMDVTEGRRRIANGVRKEAAEGAAPATGPAQGGQDVRDAAAPQAPAAPAVPEPAKPAEEVTMDRGPLYDEDVRLNEQTRSGEQAKGAYWSDEARPATEAFGQSLDAGDVIEDRTGQRYAIGVDGNLESLDESGEGTGSILRLRTSTKADKGKPVSQRKWTPSQEGLSLLARSKKVTPQSQVTKPSTPASTPTGKESLQVQKQVGQKVGIMGHQATVEQADRVDQVDYELYSGDGKGFVRVADVETGEVVSLKVYPTFEAAQNQYNDAVRIAAAKQGGADETGTSRTPKAQAVPPQSVSQDQGRAEAGPAVSSPNQGQVKQPWETMTKEQLVSAGRWNSKVADWVNWDMIRKGLNPMRMANLEDAARPGFRDRMAKDPVAEYLKSNDPEGYDRFLGGDFSAKEYQEAIAKMEKGVPNAQEVQQKAEAPQVTTGQPVPETATIPPMVEEQGVGREEHQPPTPQRPGGTIRPEIADLLDKLNRNVISGTRAKKEAKRLGLHDEFVAARAASRKPKESPESLADRRESQRLAAEAFDAKVQQYRADNPDDATVVAADPSGQLYLDVFGEEWIENTLQWREGVIEDDKQQAINEAEDAEELERATEEDYQQSKAMADTKTAATKRVMDVAESLGWNVTHVNWGYSGFGSQYVQIESPDGEQLRMIRISDHVAPMGAGFNQEKQEYYDQPDADFVLNEPGQLIDEAELRKALVSFNPSPRTQSEGTQTPSSPSTEAVPSQPAKPVEKSIYTSIPAEWREEQDLYDWGQKGLRAKGNRSIAGRKSFIWTDELERVPVRLPKATMDAFKARTDELWKVHVRKKGQEDYWLAPKRTVQEVRRQLGDDAFKQGPKPERTAGQKLNDLINSAKRQQAPDYVIGESVLDLAQSMGLTEDGLSDIQKRYVKAYRDEQASQGSAGTVQPGVGQEVYSAPETGEPTEPDDERAAIQAEDSAGEIGDFLDGLFEEEKPASKASEADTGIFGQPIFKPATGGKQGDLGLEFALAEQKAVVIKPELAAAVAKRVQAAKNNQQVARIGEDLQDFYLGYFSDLPDLFNNPTNPIPELREAFEQATKGGRLFGAEPVATGKIEPPATPGATESPSQTPVKAKEPGAKLKGDYGADRIDGAAVPGSIKGQFIADARSYLGKLKKTLGWESAEKKGTGISANPAGEGVAGDVSLTIRPAGSEVGVYVTIVGDTSGMPGVRASRSGVVLMWRLATADDRYGSRGQNEWENWDISTEDLAEKIRKAQAAKTAQMAEKKATEQPSQPTESAEIQAYRAKIRAYVRGQGGQPATPRGLSSKEAGRIIEEEQDAVEEQDGVLKMVLRSRRMKTKPAQAEQPKSDTSESAKKPTTAPWGANNTRVTRSEYEAILAKRRNKGKLPGGRESGATSMLDPEDWMDMLKIGMFHIEAGARKFAEWTELMVTDLGDEVREHLNDLWQASGGALYEKSEQAKPQEPIDTTVQEVVESSVTEQPDGTAAEQPGARRDRTGETPTSPESPAEPLSVSPEPGSVDAISPERTGAGGAVSGEGQRGGKAVRGDTGRDSGDVDQPSRRGRSPRRKARSSQQLDYRLTDADNIEAGGDRTKYKANVEAIRTLKKIEAEGRSATAEEQAILVKYTGWGGLKNAFEGWQRGWEDSPRELQELLTDEEYTSARRSTPNAHYTSPAVVRGIWDGIQKLGFKGGRINEPAIGTGIFYGLIPDDVAASSQLFGVELDSLSARISKQLYQSASIENRGFQDVKYPDNFFDLFISNVPFDEKTHPHDPDMPRDMNFNLHDFYFAKALKKTRPGGLVAFITSKGTMDKGTPAMRRWMAKQADFVGAIRLPKSAFGKIAGTEVVTDIVVFQKREAGKEDRSVPFMEVNDLEQDGQTFTVNEYFVEHPDHILGKLSYEGSMYRANELTVEDAGIDLGAKVAEIMAQFDTPVDINAGMVKLDEEMHQPDYQKLAPENVKERAYVVDGKDIYQNVDGIMQKVKVSATVADRFKKMIPVRNAARKLISLQVNPDSTDSEVQKSREDLNSQYDAFTKEYKPFHDAYNQRLFFEDPDLPLLLALENWDNETKTAGKAKIFSERTQFPVKQITSAETPQDAVAISMSEKARIDVEYIASLLGIESGDVAKQILGQAYENPETGQWEPTYLYLSGNVRKKLEAAKAAAELDPKYKPNIEALESSQPQDIPAADISVRLGASWVPEDVYGDFAAHLIGRRTMRFARLSHDGSWIVSGNGTSPQWETKHFTTSDLLAVVMNQRQPKVWGKDADGNRYLDQDATTAAQVAAEKIRDEFTKWVWKDAARTQSLSRLYNDTFNNTVHPKWDGSYLQFPGQSHTILHNGKLRPHQYNAVARFLTNGNLLLAHAVGAGKTYAGISMAMEARRTGLARKPVFVVPNHKVDDWRVDFMKLYPSANILSATKSDFEAKNRQKLMHRIATGDWDAVIVPMSSFEKIQMSPDRVQAFFQDQLDELEMMIREQKASRDQSSKSITKQLEKSKSALEERLKKMSAGWKKDAGPYFDELGIDMLFVDESHAYKNLFFTTKMERISGLQVSQTQRSLDMYLKTQFLNQTTNNHGVVFATGTPITNTIGEMYTLQRYLQPQALKDAGIEAFDFWANAFGDTVTDVEVDPTGGGFRVNTRFAKFTNLPELMQMFRGVADIVTKKQMGIPLPKLKTGRPITIQTEPTADVQDYIKGLIDRAEKVKSRQVRPDEDNMLKITNDGRHVALDARLRIPGAKDDPNSKINRCIKEVKRVYDETAKDKGTQIIWCDLSTPGKGWSIYDELRQKLIAAGIPKDQIAAIHDAKDEKQQATLYDRMNKGKLRIMLASTGKMGTGANVQQRLKAAHHLTAPWVPAEVEQRDGRIERQGNMYDEVEVYQYVTKGTFDAYMWQTLETKAKFIEQAMNGESTAREIEDVSKNSLTFAEVKALASGNPKILEAIKLDAEVKKLQAQERSHLSEQIGIREQVHTYLPSEIAFLERDIPGLEKDAAKAKAALDKAGSDIDITVKKAHYTKRAEAATALSDALSEINKLSDTDHAIGSAYGFSMTARWMQPLGASARWWRITIHGSHLLGYTADLGDSDAGNITRIINVVAGIEDKLNQSKASLSNKKQRLEEMKKLVDTPFEKAGELTEKKEQLRKIQAELQAKPGAVRQQSDTTRTGQDPTVTVPSAQGGFVGGRPGAARTTISAITRENMKTGSDKADSFLKRTKGYGWTTPAHPLKKAAASVYRFVRAFRFLPSLPKTMEFAKVREAFRQIMEVPKLAYDTAVEKMKWSLQPVEGTSVEARKRMEAVRMKLIADDLAEDVEKGVALPPGLEQADVVAMKTRADELYNTYPTVQESYDRIRQVVKETTDMLVDEGWLSKEQAKEMYFPHKVIKYLRNNDGFFGIGRKPSEPFKGYLKQRKGGADYSTDVLERLIEHWAEVRRDIDTVRFLEKVYKQEHADFMAAYPDWEEGDAIPEGYREQVILPGRFYYRVGGVTEDLATALLAQDLNAIQEILEAKDEKGAAAVKKVMALGKKRAYIIREEIAKQTLDMPTAPVSDHALYKAIQNFNTFTKRQILFNPLYAIPFHVTNFVGDSYKVSVAVPGALKSGGMVGYWKAIKAAHAGQKPVVFAEAQRRGVVGSGWLGVDVKNLEALIPELERGEVSGASKEIENKAKRLFNAAKTLGQSREDWLRYATFEYLVDLQNQGKDITRFAVKDVQVVKGLEGYDKAAKIARDILGDYSAIGKSGVFISDTVAPFYRWMHLNTPWWPRMIAEYAKRGEVGRLTAAMIAAAAPYMLAMLWNYSDDDRRKIEEKLPPWKRWNFHIVVGGKVWSLPLPVDDIANFLGIPENIADFQAYQKGFIDFRQLAGRIAANMAYSPGKAVINSVGGALGVARDLFGFKTFPDIADYRVKEWDRRAMNAMKTLFGAPAQIAEAAVRDDDKKVRDLLWRSFMPMRPWTLDRDPVDVLAGITRAEDQTAKPNDPLSWRPHLGKERDVDRLRAQVDKLTAEELKEAQDRRSQRKAEKQAKALSKLTDEDLRKKRASSVYTKTTKPSKSTNWQAHIAGTAKKGDEELVDLIDAELARRAKGK